jgi:hypothetical protein
MDPWSINPPWQNFSSLYREANSASDAKTEVERRHHLTAALYFGVAALEAFLNRKMRERQTSKPEKEVMKLLRYTNLLDKVEKWPAELIAKPMLLNDSTKELIKDFNDVRGNLTHSKTSGHDIYGKLQTVDPTTVVDTIAEYIVRFHEAAEDRFPYWVFGWNYLNPGIGGYDILPLNDQQFCFSLRALGLSTGGFGLEETWKNTSLGTYEGYIRIRNFLLSQTNCEPKFERFPLQPKLCRRWWKPEHHVTCGAVIHHFS